MGREGKPKGRRWDLGPRARDTNRFRPQNPTASQAQNASHVFRGLSHGLCTHRIHSIPFHALVRPSTIASAILSQVPMEGPPIAGDCEWKVRVATGGSVRCTGKWETATLMSQWCCWQSVCSEHKGRKNGWHRKWWMRGEDGTSRWVQGSTTLRSVENLLCAGYKLGEWPPGSMDHVGCDSSGLSRYAHHFTSCQPYYHMSSAFTDDFNEFTITFQIRSSVISCANTSSAQALFLLCLRHARSNAGPPHPS